MIGLIDSYEFDSIFWKIHPTFRLVEPFKSFYKSDKTRDHVSSSEVMWAISLIYDRASKFYNLPETGEGNKVEFVCEEFLKDKNYFTKNERVITPLIDMYRKMTETPALRSLRAWEEKMEERAKFIKVTPYSLDSYEFDEESGKSVKVAGTAKLLDDLLKNTKSLFDDFERINKSLQQEGGESALKGGGEKSLSDRAENF